MELAETLKNKRLELCLTQDELAALIFVSKRTITNWENGKTYPDAESLLRLADLYQISLDELFDRHLAPTKIRPKPIGLLIIGTITIVAILIGGKYMGNFGMLILSAIVFYFVIKYAVRDAIIEAKVKEKPLIKQAKIDDLFEQMTIDWNELDNTIKKSKNLAKENKKEFLAKLKKIQDEATDLDLQEMDVNEKYTQLLQFQQKLTSLINEVEVVK